MPFADSVCYIVQSKEITRLKYRRELWILDIQLWKKVNFNAKIYRKKHINRRKQILIPNFGSPVFSEVFGNTREARM